MASVVRRLRNAPFAFPAILADLDTKAAVNAVRYWSDAWREVAVGTKAGADGEDD